MVHFATLPKCFIFTSKILSLDFRKLRIFPIHKIFTLSYPALMAFNNFINCSDTLKSVKIWSVSIEMELLKCG